LGLKRGHRPLTIIRKGGKVVTVPLAPRPARAIGLPIGERTCGPVFLAADGRRLDRHCAGRIVHKAARGAGIAKAVPPRTLRDAFITAVDAGWPMPVNSAVPSPRTTAGGYTVLPGKVQRSGPVAAISTCEPATVAIGGKAPS
jgi:integrase